MAATAARPPPGRRAAPGLSRGPGPPGLLVLTAVLVLYLGRSTNFWFDEWDFVLDPARVGRATRCWGRTTSISRSSRS